ncbi:beta-ketoacyl synthase N-terminal-like domain-containing protein [Polymorphospora sp. NPDC051019]|uniref:beta-ketoacyl synthase N-terminal-like domain-containing protein n=1 Tax=Polymorphospora sp. NPDC051019 TaxID=3155725 RepID=UPI00344A9E3F
MTAVAVVGMGVALPGASTPDELWDLLRSGRSVLSAADADPAGLAGLHDPDPAVADRSYNRVYGPLSDLRPHPRLRAETDVGDAPPGLTTYWLRHCLLQALDTTTVADRDRCAFAIGYGVSGSINAEQAFLVEAVAQGVGAYDADAGQIPDLVRRALAGTYPFAGPEPHVFLPHEVGRRAAAGLLPPQTEIVTIDTACSASLYAVQAAISALSTGTADVVFCGGACNVTPSEYVMLSQVGLVSANDQLRSFDVAGTGSLWSEGAAVVALKTLDRAVADGDEVLGVIAGLGTSSDGRGREVLAPDSRGQALAIRRSLESAGVAAGSVDWILAHAIGVPAGDAVEFAALREAADSATDCLVTVNKPQFGHTSWASGLLSLVHVLLALRNETVPAQRRFTRTPESYRQEATRLRIPVTDAPWPRTADRPRIAGVNSFGFGGTNVHAVVTDTPRVGGFARRSGTGEIAVVGWGAHLPGAPTATEVLDQLRRAEWHVPPGFGESYPLPDPVQLRMPPIAARNLDRTQLMLIQSMLQLAGEHGEVWAPFTDTTGVFVGHHGVPGAFGPVVLRINRDLIAGALAGVTDATAAPAVDRFLKSLQALAADPDETVGGLLPNFIASRATKRFDLRGMAMVVDQGIDSALGAVHLAMRALHTRELDMALVGGVNGNSGPELRAILGAPFRSPAVDLAEGAFTLALARPDTAAEHGLPILARLRAGQDPHDGPATVRCGPSAGRSYLGGDGALAILSAVATGGTVRVEPYDPAIQPAGILVRV